MAVTLAQLEEQARQLPAEERARLAEILLESLQEAPSAHVEAAWNEEIAARVATYDRGESQSYTAEDVFAEARRLAQ
ncbi:MAG: addiction module protein [Chloroflexota bacterium]